MSVRLHLSRNGQHVAGDEGHGPGSGYDVKSTGVGQQYVKSLARTDELPCKGPCGDQERVLSKMKSAVVVEMDAGARGARGGTASVGRCLRSNGGCLSMLQGATAPLHPALPRNDCTAHTRLAIRTTPQKVTFSCILAPLSKHALSTPCIVLLQHSVSPQQARGRKPLSQHYMSSC